MGEGFFRQTRRVFAGMLCAFQENATQYGGKRPVHTAFEVVNTGSQGVADCGDGHPLKNPPFTGESDRGVSGYPSGAERIRTRLPLFPLPLLGAVIGKWAGSTFAAPGCVGVLAGRLPGAFPGRGGRFGKKRKQTGGFRAALVCYSIPGGATADRRLVVAKSAVFRFRLRRKLHTLPCSSSPHKA